MGSSESHPETKGWRILEVIPNGPMWNKGICVYFDFIVGINGVRLNTSSEEFWDLINNKQDSEIVLTVFNFKTRIKRDIIMIPNNKWGGDGLLGLVIVRDDFTKCDQQCIRILSVNKNSPASIAGLQAEYDYILGTPINAFTTFSIFRDTISDYIDQPLPMYVYNSKNATVRLVEITPSSKWIGDGVLGIICGDGYLHHIPTLNDEQETIIYQPNSCYIVSSRNSQQNQNYHSSTVSPPKKRIDEKKEEKIQPIEQKGNDYIDIEDDQELPTIRWTDSAHSHHKHEAGCSHQHQDTTTTVSTEKSNLLDKLQQETEQVLLSSQ
eukprot:241730_1